ncbi:MAG: FtsW/RodA/SpoVE family cell cycle protein [Clostridia bacterium]|nr:FtsW/RodA/SpoVE family cell cycle protein [Clostridia bacterium]
MTQLYTKVEEKRFAWFPVLLLITVFQIISFIQVILKTEDIDLKTLGVFSGYIVIECLYFLIAWLVTKKTNFELEMIAFFLSGIGLAISASVEQDFAFKQFVAIILGLVGFVVLNLILKDVDLVMKLRMPVAIGAVALLIVNILLASEFNGTLNWISIGGISIQPSELVKVAFVFVGAATLEKLQSARSITKYIIFAVACVGILFLMRDFGTALIFFFTFIIIAFMRSGDIRTIILICAAALLGALLIIYFKPYVATRFATYRHVWDYIDDQGFQQTRTLIYSAAGGLFGVGIGNGELKDIFASTTDLVFGMLCEEWGILLAFVVISCFAFITIYTIKSAKTSISAFYTIASCSAAALLMFQCALNVFGCTDILPFTGVTLPFISRGGTSMICCWAMLSFIKSADTFSAVPSVIKKEVAE